MVQELLFCASILVPDIECKCIFHGSASQAADEILSIYLGSWAFSVMLSTVSQSDLLGGALWTVICRESTRGSLVDGKWPPANPRCFVSPKARRPSF